MQHNKWNPTHLSSSFSNPLLDSVENYIVNWKSSSTPQLIS